MDDADLERLTVKPGKLVPKFNRNTTEYSLLLNSGISELKIDPLTRDSSASWVVVGVGTTRTLTVAEGTCYDICIEVTAEDGTSKRQYTIKVTSLSSRSAVLSNITVRGHTLQPSPSMGILEYQCRVPASSHNISVTASSPDKATKVVIEGASEDSTIPLNYGTTQVHINVTSPDSTNTATYTITVNRTRFLFPFNMRKHACQICLAPLHCPVSLKGDPVGRLFCEGCVMLVTRSSKYHPMTGEELPADFIVHEDEKQLNEQLVPCVFGCGEQVQLRMLAHHVTTTCSQTFNHVASVDQVLYGKYKDDELMNSTSSCGSCGRPVAKNELKYHTDNICESTNERSKFAHKVDVKKWEKNYQQEVLLTPGQDPLVVGKAEEEKYLQLLNTGQKSDIGATGLKLLEKARQFYCHGVIDQPKKAEIHFRLAVILEEMQLLKDVFGAGAKEAELVVVEEGDEFQTEESMQDDIRALAEQCGFGSNASATDQLKALDQEYHFLLEQGQSERADYVQKLYAFKQKQHLREGNVKTTLTDDTLLGQSLNKYLDAATTEPNTPGFHMHAGRVLLRMEKCEEALKRLKCAYALKPTCVKTRFYLGYAMSKFSPDKEKEVYMDLLRSGLHYFLYVTNWNTTEQPEQVCVSETFASLHNSIIFKGIYQLASLQGLTDGGAPFHDPDTLLRFVSLLCYTAMFDTLHRGDVYKNLLSLALQCQYDIGSHMMEASKVESEVLRAYWERLSTFTSNVCRFGNVDALNIQKKICEAAVLVTPRSSRALCHLAEVLYLLHEDNLEGEQLQDIQLYFRSSLSMEGKNIHGGEIPEHLLQTTFWKDHVKKQEEKAAKAAAAAAKGKATTSTAKPPSNKAGDDTKRAVGARTGVKPSPSKGVGTGGRGAPGASTTSTTAPPRSTKVPSTGKSNTGTSSVKSNAKTAPRGRPVGNTNTPSSSSSHHKSHENTKPQPTRTISKHKNLKTGKDNPATTTPTKVQAKEQPKEPTTPPTTAPKEEPNPTLYQSRLGLARSLVASQQEGSKDEAAQLFREVITMSPQIHSAYIELGEMLATTDPLAAVDTYTQFTSATGSSYDDAYIYGEIVRLLMKEKMYEDSRLKENMIMLGKVLGFSSLERYVGILEKDFKNNRLLREVYAGVNGKPVDDPDLQQFFKFKCWK